LPGGGLLFSTGASGVARHPEVSRTPNQESIALTLCGLEIACDASHFARVNALPPGYYLVFEDGRVSTAPYFVVPAVGDDQRPLDEIITDYRQRFLKSVEWHSRLSVQLGVALSGGLDSSSVLRALTRTADRSQHLLALSVQVPGDHLSDERAYAALAVEGTGVRADVVPASETIDWHELLETADSPDTILWAPLMNNVAREFRARGINRVVAGCLGDLVGGMDFAGLLTLFARRELGAFLGDFYLPDRRWMPYAVRSAIRALLDCTRCCTRSGREQLVAAAERQAATSGFGVPPWIPEKIVNQFGLRERWRRILQWQFESVMRSSDRFREMLPLGYGELAVVRHCARLAGVDFGVPFADRALVELSARLPTLARRYRGTTRYVHREALRGVLPEPIRVRRDKAKFVGYFTRIRNQWVVPSPKNLSNVSDWLDMSRVLSADLRQAGEPWGGRWADLCVTSAWLLRHGG
jgi:asparagine synthase (glutamine-hydrolysing)